MFDQMSMPAEATPRVAPADRIAALAEVFLCSGFPTQVLLLVVMNALGMRLQTADGTWSPLFVATLSLLDTGLIVGLVVMFLRVHGENPRDVLAGPRPAMREAVLGFALLPIVFMLTVVLLGLILTLAPQLHNVQRNPMADLMQNPRDAVIFAFVVLIAGGVREEFQRGFILHRFSRYLGGGVVGVIVHSTLFGLGHVDQGWDAALTVGMLGALWGTIYLIRRSIIAPMVSHAGFNLAQLLKFLTLQ
jgi:membrane protease YdiL (CAAX protease family)